MKQPVAFFAVASAFSCLATAQFHHNHGHGHLHKRDLVYETQYETKIDVVQTTIYVPAGGASDSTPAPSTSSQPPANPPSDSESNVKAADYKAPPAQPPSQGQSPEQIQQLNIQHQEELNKEQEQKNQQQVQYNNQYHPGGQQGPPPPQPSYSQAATSAAAPAAAPSSESSSGGGGSGGPAGGGPTKTSTVSYYEPEQGGQKTSCGLLVKNSEPGVALPMSIMNANKSNLCGKSISVNWNGKQMSFPIIDSCQGCDSMNRIDLTVGSFTQNFAPTATGIVNNVQWSLPSV